MNKYSYKNEEQQDLVPFIATHPGELIKDELTERKMTQKQLADLTGIKTSILSQTINGKRPISLNMAIKLEKAIEIPAELWMNFQTQYNLDSANILKRQKKQITATIHVPIQDRNLLKELSKKFGWVCLF